MDEDASKTREIDKSFSEFDDGQNKFHTKSQHFVNATSQKNIRTEILMVPYSRQPLNWKIPCIKYSNTKINSTLQATTTTPSVQALS